MTTINSPVVYIVCFMVRYDICVAIYGNSLGPDSGGINGGVFSPKCFDQSFDGKNILSFYLVYGTLFPNQLAGLGDGCELIRNVLNADLISLNVIPSAHPGHECYEYDGLFTWIY